MSVLRSPQCNCLTVDKAKSHIAKSWSPGPESQQAHTVKALDWHARHLVKPPLMAGGKFLNLRMPLRKHPQRTPWPTNHLLVLTQKCLLPVLSFYPAKLPAKDPTMSPGKGSCKDHRHPYLHKIISLNFI